MSATPRTDAHCSEGAWERTSDLAEFAGRLEIELYEWHRIAGEQIERLTRERDAFAERWRKTDEEVERLRVLLRWIADDVLDYGQEHAEERIRAALGEDGKIKIPSTSGPAATTQPECQAKLGEE